MRGLPRPAAVEPEELEARRSAFEAAIEWIKSAQAADQPEFEHVYEDVLHRYEHRLAAVVDDGASHPQGLDRATYMKMRTVQDQALEVERVTLIGMRERGVVGDEVLRTLQRELDLAESRGRTLPK